MADEEVIKRRLLIDGDGTGDDRRLNTLARSFIKWVSSNNDSPEIIQLGYDRLLAQLAQVEFAATKSESASGMMKQELRNYEAISQTIDSGIEQAKTQIDQSKANLVLAKQIRKNRMEYDVLARIISAQPDRRKTTDKLDTLKRELAELEQNRLQLQRKLDVRRNDFAVLMRSIRELQARLDVEPTPGDEVEEEDVDAEGVDRAEKSRGVEDIDDADDIISADGDVDMVSAETSGAGDDADCSNDPPTKSNGTPEV